MVLADYPGHLLAAAALAALATMIALAYRSAQVRGRRPWLIGFMQFAAILILLLILCDPSMARYREERRRNRVLVLFDTSESMSVVEKDGMARLDKALALFEQHFDPADPEGADFEIYGFDRECYRSDSHRALFRWGERTNLRGALAAIEKAVSSRGQAGSATAGPAGRGKVVGAVVFTDGQADSKDPGSYLPPSSGDPEILLVGVGSRSPRGDVAVKALTAPARAAIDTAYNVQVVVTGKDLGGQAVTVELLKNGEIVGSEQLAGEALAQGATVEFVLAADRIGSHTLIARALTSEPEPNPGNNARSATVRVVENPRMKVLFYSQVASFDVGKVRQALARDRRIELDLGLDAIVRPAMSERARTMSGHVPLPDSRAGFYEYDVIVLGPCSVNELAGSQLDGLYSFVVHRGGGLILLPGRDEYAPPAWRDPRARALLPVTFRAGSEGVGAAPRGRAELTTEGAALDALVQAGIDVSSVVTAACHGQIEKKPAATTLATLGETPLICAHRVGRGRVCLVNTAKLYKWYRQDLDGGALRQVMSALTGYVGRVRALEAQIDLFARRLDEEPGTVRFEAHVRDRWLDPVAGATVLLTMQGNVFSMDEAGGGKYAAEVKNVSAEALLAAAQAERRGEFLGEKTLAVNLPFPRREMDNVELDDGFLGALADRLGGTYVHADDLSGNQARSFEATTRSRVFSHMTSIWPTWLLLAALCVLLSVNWFVRRAMGLV